jgi:hypothetical protein
MSDKTRDFRPNYVRMRFGSMQFNQETLSLDTCNYYLCDCVNLPIVIEMITLTIIGFLYENNHSNRSENKLW